MLGIENLKVVAKFGIDLGEKAASVLADGKMTGNEVFELLPVLMSIPGILQKKDAIVAEFKDLSTDERAELNAFIQLEFDIPNDQLETKIEKGLTAVVAVLDLVTAFQKPAA